MSVKLSQGADANKSHSQKGYITINNYVIILHTDSVTVKYITLKIMSYTRKLFTFPNNGIAKALKAN